jgi:hypothetical protein
MPKLFDYADFALYQAQSHGRDGYWVYEHNTVPGAEASGVADPKPHGRPIDHHSEGSRMSRAEKQPADHSLAAHHFFMVHGYKGPAQVQAWPKATG